MRRHRCAFMFSFIGHFSHYILGIEGLLFPFWVESFSRKMCSLLIAIDWSSAFAFVRITIIIRPLSACPMRGDTNLIHSHNTHNHNIYSLSFLFSPALLFVFIFVFSHLTLPFHRNHNSFVHNSVCVCFFFWGLVFLGPYCFFFSFFFSSFFLRGPYGVCNLFLAVVEAAQVCFYHHHRHRGRLWSCAAQTARLAIYLMLSMLVSHS